MTEIHIGDGDHGHADESEAVLAVDAGAPGGEEGRAREPHSEDESGQGG